MPIVQTVVLWRRKELNVSKNNFPKNTLIYANQGSLVTIKGDHVIYLQYFIPGHLIVALNQSENIETYQCKDDEVQLVNLIYDPKIGEFKGIEMVLVHIMVRGDDN